MRIYITADMEGTAGVTGWAQTEPGEPSYEAARRLMTGEVNAAIDGAFLGGAAEVIVNDSHDGMRNLLLDELDPRADLVSGSPKPWSMVEGLTADSGLMLCTGYHAMAGSRGNLAHTYNLTVQEVRISGRLVGELGLNAYYAGSLGVAVGAVSGDDVLEAEAKELLPKVRFARVKDAAGRYGATSLGAERARAAIRAAAEAAVRSRAELSPLRPPAQPELAVRFLHAGQAQLAAICPGCRRTGPLEVQFGHEDYLEVFRAFRTMVTLAGGVK